MKREKARGVFPKLREKAAPFFFPRSRPRAKEKTRKRKLTFFPSFESPKKKLSLQFPIMWAHIRAFYGGSDVALGHAYAHITAVATAAQIVGGPLAALLLRLDGFWNLSSWQMLFLFEAVPTLGVAGWVMALPRSPETAKCLDPEARKWLGARAKSAGGGGAVGVAPPPPPSPSSSPPGSSRERDYQRYRQLERRGSSSSSPQQGLRSSLASVVAAARSSLTSWRIWALGGMEALVSAVSFESFELFFFFSKRVFVSVRKRRGKSSLLFPSLSSLKKKKKLQAKYAVIYWTPLLVAAMVTKGGDEFSTSPKESSTSSLHHAPPPPASAAAAVAALSAVPFGLAAVATLANSAHSKRTGERRWHVVWPVVACAAGLAGLGLTLNRERRGEMAAISSSSPAAAPDGAFAARAAAPAFASLVVASLVFAATGVVASYPSSIINKAAAAAAAGATGGGGSGAPSSSAAARPDDAAAALGYGLANALGGLGEFSLSLEGL